MASVSFKKLTDSKLKRFSLDIDDGEFITLTGDTNSGAYEAVQIAAGISRKYEGMVLVGEHHVFPGEKYNGGACLITSLPLFATPRRMLRAAMTLEGVRDDDARLIEAAKTAKLDDSLLDTRVMHLTAALRLKVGMAVAIATNAGAVLMDEPLSGIDLAETKDVAMYLRDMHAVTGKTFIAAIANAGTALSLSTRIALMKDGELIQCDTPQTIYDHPLSTFAARYFGSSPINLIPAKLERDGEGIFAVFGSARVKLHASKVAKLISEDYIGKNVIIGARAENFHDEGAFIAVASDSAFDVNVHQVEILGEITLLHIRIDGLDDNIIARVDPRSVARAGDNMKIALDVNRITLYDADTGNSILKRA